MLRSAASPGSVGFGRFGSGTSGLLMTPLPAGHLFWSLFHRVFCVFHRWREVQNDPRSGAQDRPISSSRQKRRASDWRLGIVSRAVHLILASRNSTCFLATGSYFFFVSFSVMVREFFLVT